jgi:hypothetical protein
MLEMCDPNGNTRRHVAQLLGPHDHLKALYVERFCLCLEAWLDDMYLPEYARRLALETATKAVEQRILAAEPEPRVPFDRIRLDGHSILQPCHHKLFRRYDIILSSIGDGQWRKSMPMRGTDGTERAAEMEPYLSALERWACAEVAPAPDGPSEADLYPLLGTSDPFKRFAIALLASLLRAQQIAARQQAERRRATPT